MRVFLVFLAGFVVSYLAIVAGALWYMDVADIADRDGGGTMGIIFTLGPLGALIGGTAAAGFAAAHNLRRRQPRPEEDTASRPSAASRPRRIALAALIAGAAAYLAAAFVGWLLSGATYASYWTPLLIVWSPYLLGLVAGALAAWLAARSPPATF